MKIVRILGSVLAVYVVFVFVFEAGYLGYFQPSFEEGGIPMLVLTTTDRSGEPRDRMLARFELDGKLYVSAHHWTQGWYHQALKNPQVRVSIDGQAGDYRAVPVTGEEYQRVVERYPLPFVARFLMGFPPKRNILRLDPVEAGSSETGRPVADSRRAG